MIQSCCIDLPCFICTFNNLQKIIYFRHTPPYDTSIPSCNMILEVASILHLVQPNRKWWIYLLSALQIGPNGV